MNSNFGEKLKNAAKDLGIEPNSQVANPQEKIERTETEKRNKNW